jgi:hypothetical protein
MQAMILIHHEVSVETLQELFKKFKTLDYHLSKEPVGHDHYINLFVEGVDEDVEKFIVGLGHEAYKVVRL